MKELNRKIQNGEQIKEASIKKIIQDIKNYDLNSAVNKNNNSEIPSNVKNSENTIQQLKRGKILDNKHYHIYPFLGQAGNQVIISVIGSNDFAPEVRLYSPERRLSDT